MASEGCAANLYYKQPGACETSMQQGDTEQQPGDTIWMKMRGFPRWPAKVCSPQQGGAEVARQRKVGHTLVLSFGDHMYVWVAPSNLTAFTAASADEALLKGGSIRLKQACPAPEL